MKNKLYIGFMSLLEILMQIPIPAAASSIMLYGICGIGEFSIRNTFFVILPVTAYFFVRRMVKKSGFLFVCIHGMIACTTFIGVAGTAEEKGMIFLVAAVAAVFSYRRSDEKPKIYVELPALIVLYILGLTSIKEYGAYVALGCTIIYIIAYIIHANLWNFREFLVANQEYSDFAVNQANSVNTVMLLAFMVVCILMMGIIPSIFAAPLGRAVMMAGYYIRRLILRFQIDVENEESPMQSQPVKGWDTEEGGEAVVLDMGEGSDLLDGILIFIGIVLLCGLIFFVIRAVKNSLDGFKGRQKEGTDVKEFVKPVSFSRHYRKAVVKEKHTETGMNLKIRKRYARIIKKQMGKEEVNKKLTPKEITAYAFHKKGIQDNQGITDIYEKARYSNETMSEAEYSRMKL